MPNLPTIFVTDAQAARMLAAYGDAAGYKAWLRQQIIAYVISKEIEADDKTYMTQREAKRTQAATDLEPPA